MLPKPQISTKISAPLDSTLTGELDGAQWYLGLAGEEILLAALGLAIARTIGEGVVPVDVAGHGAVSLSCTSAGLATATEALGAVHRSLSAGPAAPTLAAQPPAEIYFSYLRRRPGPAATRSSSGPTAPTACVQLDWWYDTRSFDPYTVEELAEQFPLALIELTSEARRRRTRRWQSVCAGQ